ncbi:hypothetical protein [Promicromonospora sp. AC04]|uniref:hypothetical protein n=1 Tax=Promicromonospora sp. AC04 TaxID=2135723 RepID=UPI0018EEA083|nr:hypothetical protein [Promicromonospora sp. AC04]
MVKNDRTNLIDASTSVEDGERLDLDEDVGLEQVVDADERHGRARARFDGED